MVPDSPDRPPAVSVVLPVHNQADHLQRIVQGYVEAFTSGGIRHELILVVNGCSDASPALAADLGRRHPSVRTITSEKSGWGHAVKLGIAAARGDLVAYTNSARTSADDLVRAVSLAVNNPGVVVKASRRIRESAVRRTGSVIYNFECRMLFDLACWDVNGTPKVFPRTCTRLLSLTREDDLIDLEFNVVARDERYPLIEMPIVATARHGGRSTTSVRGAVRLYWGAVRFWRTRARAGVRQ
jgi:glycosyltransferase involved in cell wall biosynthesis